MKKLGMYKTELDIIELNMSINAYLKPGIRIEDLTLEQKINIYKELFHEDIELKNPFILKNKNGVLDISVIMPLEINYEWKNFPWLNNGPFAGDLTFPKM